MVGSAESGMSVRCTTLERLRPATAWLTPRIHHHIAASGPHVVLVLSQPPAVIACRAHHADQQHEDGSDHWPAAPGDHGPFRFVVSPPAGQSRRVRPRQARPRAPGQSSARLGLAPAAPLRQQVSARGGAVAAHRLAAWAAPRSERADDDGFLARRLPRIGVDDVSEHAGDVVRTAAADRQVDSCSDGRVQVGQLHQGLLQRLVADDVGQAVRAEQVPVADLGLEASPDRDRPGCCSAARA